MMSSAHRKAHRILLELILETLHRLVGTLRLYIRAEVLCYPKCTGFVVDLGATRA